MIPGSGRSLGGGHSNPLQYSCLENPMDRGDWWAMACAKSLKSCLTLCNPVDCSPPGLCPWNSPSRNTGVGCHALLQGIFPTQGSNVGLQRCRQILYHLSHQGRLRILEWVALIFFKGTSQPRNRIGVSCIVDVTLEEPIVVFA